MLADTQREIASSANRGAPIITVDRLVKRYRHTDVNAVDGISFDVAPGAFFALLGPNGAGKTTTISILTTTLAPTSGQVRIGGRDLVRETSAVRREIGIIFQKPSLDLNLTAEENIRFHASLYGLYPFRPSFGLMPKEYRLQVQELAELLDLGDALKRPVKKFSGGMQRKLEIVRSLIHRPRVLFLDEPTSGLDPISRRNLWEYLARVRAESGATIFLTTHYLEEAEGADTICIINQGRIVSLGTPAAVKAELVKEYLLLDAADRDRLREELRALRVDFTEMPQFRVPVSGQQAHTLLRRIETPLTVLRLHTPSLEDVYLEIVGNDA
jgi:ABC-2 type transport system ATP-binding protein